MSRNELPYFLQDVYLLFNRLRNRTEVTEYYVPISWSDLYYYQKATGRKLDDFELLCLEYLDVTLRDLQFNINDSKSKE